MSSDSHSTIDDEKLAQILQEQEVELSRAAGINPFSDLEGQGLSSLWLAGSSVARRSHNLTAADVIELDEFSGDVPKTLAPTVYDPRMPIYTNEAEGLFCYLCLEDIQKGDRVRATFCGQDHVFHTRSDECPGIESYFEHNFCCPICQTDLKEVADSA